MEPGSITGIAETLNFLNLWLGSDRLLGLSRQLTAGVLGGEGVEAHRLDLAAVTSRTKGLIALGANLLHVLDRRLQEVAGVKFFRLGGQGLPNSSRDCQAVVRVDVDLADAALNPLLNFFHWDAVGFGNVATVLVDQGKQIFRH